MKDFNFFSPYLLEKRNKRLKRIYIISVSLFFVIGLFSFISLNLYQIEKYKSEINKVESYIKSQNAIDLLNKYDETTQKVELTNSYYNKVKEVDNTLNAYNTVNTKLLDKLSSTMPQDATMISLIISNREIEIQYSVKDLVTVAELEHNLKALSIFDTINVSTINNETSYTTTINFRLKDVNDGEAEADK